jgi:hypothetical protein
MHSLTKCYVRIRFPPEVEPVRMLELLLVAVGRSEDSEDQLTTRRCPPEGTVRSLFRAGHCGAAIPRFRT